MTKMLEDGASLDEVRALFDTDRFAHGLCGCEVKEASRGHAVCTLAIDPERHLNGMKDVMGGALFTLADFALAVACNYGEEPSVSASNTIEFLDAARGTVLTATAEADRSGHHLGFYTVDITDDTGVHVARMTATCYRNPA
jgi:acyl-CoA thioesterase